MSGQPKQYGCCSSGCALMFAALVAWVVFVAVQGPRPGGSGPRPEPAAPPPFVGIPPGTPVTLFRPGGAGNTLIYDSKADAIDMEDTDRPGIVGKFSRLREAGLVVGVANGTGAVVVASEREATMVRVTEGPQEGRTGWVSSPYARRRE